MVPILLSIGPIKIYSYGVFITLAFLVATFLIWKLSREEELDEEKIFDLLFITLFFGIIGARIFYVFLHQDQFTPNLIRIVHLTKFPGLAFYGGLISATLTAIFYLLKNKLSVWQIGDIFVLGLCLGQAIARIGSFLNGCCYGIRTTLPWGVYFPGLLGKRHPTQIYEAILDFLIFLILFSIYKKTFYKKTLDFAKGKQGQVFLFYFILTGVAHFALEFLRDDSVYWRGTRIAQILNGIMVIITMGVFIIKYRIEVKEWTVNKIEQLFKLLKKTTSTQSINNK